MDENRIRPVTPSPTRLKYEPNRKNNSGQKKKRDQKPSHEPDADNEHVIDDFA